MEDFFCEKCAGAFRRYIPRREWETFKAEVQEEGTRRKEDAQAADGNGSTGNVAKGVKDEKGVREAPLDLPGDGNG